MSIAIYTDTAGAITAIDLSAHTPAAIADGALCNPPGAALARTVPAWGLRLEAGELVAISGARPPDLPAPTTVEVPIDALEALKAAAPKEARTKFDTAISTGELDAPLLRP